MPASTRGCLLSGCSWGRVVTSALTLTVAAAFCSGMPAAAQAGGIVVSTTENAGPGSLRQAIRTANATAAADTITFSVRGTITVTGALPAIETPVAIIGPGADSLTIDGAGKTEVLDVADGARLRLVGVTIADGSTDAGMRAGGIRNSGVLVLGDCVFTANRGGEAGGLLNFGAAAVTGSKFVGNRGRAGGIENQPGASLRVARSSFRGNATSRGAGGILNDGTLTVLNSLFAHNLGGGGVAGIVNRGTAFLTNSTFRANSAEGAGAARNRGIMWVLSSRFIGNSGAGDGGIQNNGTLFVEGSDFVANRSSDTSGGITNTGRLTVIGSTFDRNVGGEDGGVAGIENFGVATISGSTFLRNVAGGDRTGFGSGIVQFGRSLAVMGSTFSHNPDGLVAGGCCTSVVNSTFSRDGGYQSYGGHRQTVSFSTFFRAAVHGPVTVSGTVVSASKCVGAVTDAGYNLDSGASCRFSAPGSISDVDPLLLPLARNGGPTETMALPPGSPAVNVIPRHAIGCGAGLRSDQRGLRRPQHHLCDMGAFELASLGGSPTVR